jgi:hypothetical protein
MDAGGLRAQGQYIVSEEGAMPNVVVGGERLGVARFSGRARPIRSQN